MKHTAQLQRLPREFFDRPSTDVAPDLLGCVLWHDSPAGLVAVRLVEVEAYQGPADPASHAFRGQTPRNGVMFGPPGHAYVYFTYGMHFCVNLVCQPAGQPEAVLIRAGEVIEGAELAGLRRRGRVADPAADLAVAGADGSRRIREFDLARGPGRLCQALGIDKALDGADVCGPDSPLGIGRAADGDSPRPDLHGPAGGHQPGNRPAVAILAGGRRLRFRLSPVETESAAAKTSFRLRRPKMGRCTGERHH